MMDAKNRRPTEGELMAVWEALLKVDPKNPLRAAKGYEKVLEALKWYVDNDDTNLWDPQNEFWIEGWIAGRKAIKKATGVDPYPDEPMTLKEVLKSSKNEEL